jgi:hypothetical protein
MLICAQLRVKRISRRGSRSFSQSIAELGVKRFLADYADFRRAVCQRNFSHIAFQSLSGERDYVDFRELCLQKNFYRSSSLVFAELGVKCKIPVIFF